jgi:peroxiredoxin
LASTSDRADVERTRNALNITYSLIPGPNQKVAEGYEVWNAQRRLAIGTVIIDKAGIIRFVHQPITGDEDRPTLSNILQVLKAIQQ